MGYSKRGVAVGLMLVGMALGVVVAPGIQESTAGTVTFGISFAGGLLMFAGAVWRDVILRAEGVVDERYAQIHYRAGWYAFAATVAILVTTSISAANADLAVEESGVVALVPVVGLAVYFGTVTVLKRRM